MIAGDGETLGTVLWVGRQRVAQRDEKAETLKEEQKENKKRKA